MLLSPTARLAIRALVYLATRSGEGPILGRDIADAEMIPKPFLAKILHTLVNRGLVRSTKGPRGGYELAMPASEIVIGDVVEAIDGRPDLEGICLLGLDDCSDESPCALHSHWKRFREQFTKRIWELKLSQAAQTLQSKRGK